MTFEEFDAEIQRIRVRAGERRAAAWSPVPDFVLGLPLRTVTPATFGLLVGTRNAFVCGLRAREGAVRDWILFHSPGFDPDSPTPRFWSRLLIRFRIELALLRPTAAKLNAKQRRAVNLSKASEEIRAIVRDAFADGLPDDGSSPGPTVAAGAVAQLCDLFASQYTFWPLPQPIRHTPIAQLYQLARCRDRANAPGKTSYFDREEAALTASFLEEMNREAIANPEGRIIPQPDFAAAKP